MPVELVASILAQWEPSPSPENHCQFIEGTNPVYKAIELLMVDDNPADIRLWQECLKGLTVSNHLSVVRDDVEALCFLHRQGVYALAKLPDIILISIRIIWMNDKGLLMQIKNDAGLKDIPVVILTAFEGEEASLDDDLPISLCVSKPLNLDDLIAIVNLVGDFDLTKARPMSVPKRDGLGQSLDSHVFAFQHTN